MGGGGFDGGSGTVPSHFKPGVSQRKPESQVIGSALMEFRYQVNGSECFSKPQVRSRGKNQKKEKAITQTPKSHSVRSRIPVNQTFQRDNTFLSSTFARLEK